MPTSTSKPVLAFCFYYIYCITTKFKKAEHIHISKTESAKQISADHISKNPDDIWNQRDLKKTLLMNNVIS